MYNDMLVIDGVIHMYDQRDENILDTDYARSVQRHWHNIVTGPPLAGGLQLNPLWASEAISVEKAGRLLFEESDTDMAVAQVVPFFSYWKNGFAPVEANHALAQAYPDRVIFCGGVDPIWHGQRHVLTEMERQVVELGAQSIKFYNCQHNKAWRCDDRTIAYPMYEKALELGLNNIQFHKGVPFGQESLEHLSPNDLTAAARDFPELTFIIHHLGDPFLAETMNLCSRFENVMINMSGYIVPYVYVAPYRAYHAFGQALQTCGVHKLMYGSEAFSFNGCQSTVAGFAGLQMPEELQDKYGYPEITRDIMAPILGENIAKIFKIDVEKKKRELAAKPLRVQAA